MKVVCIVQAMNGRSEDEIISERNAIAHKLQSALGEIEVIPSLTPAADAINGRVAVRLLAKELTLLSDADIAVFGAQWDSSRMCAALHRVCMDFGMDTLCLTDAALGGAADGAGK